MMKHENILNQIPDYVSGLLPANEQRIFERHLAHCSACQRAAVHERAMQRLMHTTIDLATKPNPEQMRKLMPPVPRGRTPYQIWPIWQKRLAPALLILLLVFGGLLINNIIPTKNSPAFVVTAHAATATSTITPLAPPTDALPEREQKTEGSSMTAQTNFEVAVPEPPADWAQPLKTPDPQPTPVAAGRQVLQ